MFLLADTLWLRKITTYPHIFAYVNIQWLDGKPPKLKIYISELILDTYKYIPASHQTMHCRI
jgi:hypothetical protein